jgi:Dolichyl-phosphate-mannose-protein mannosyltransferase
MRSRLELAVPLVLVLTFVVVAAIDAEAFPYHEWDALSFGEWSRLIGEHWRLHFPTATAAEYQRPVLYVLQGVAWGLFGFSERLGRTIDLLFGIALVVAVYELGRRELGRACGAISATLLLLVPEVQRGFTSGLTDVPVAAVVGLALLAAFRDAPILLGVASCAAVLTKTSALPALVGLALACCVGARTDGVRRTLRLVGAIAAGAAVALLYDLTQASRVHMSLLAFLRSGSDGYYSTLAAHARRSAIFDAAWLGGTLRILVLFALAYATLRAVGLAHRSASLAATAAAPVLAYVGPLVASHFSTWRVGPLASWTHALGTCALLVTLAATSAARDVPSETALRRLLLAALPPLAVWAWFGGYDLRLLSPAWPALISLCGASLHTAVAAPRGRAALLALPAAAAVAVAVAAGLENIDGIGSSGWRAVQTAPSGFFDLAANRRILLPSFSDVLTAVRPVVGSDGRLISNDGKFRFYFPGRVAQTYPRACADLSGYRVYVYLGDGASVAYMRSIDIPTDLSYWSACTKPKLQLLAQADNLAAFRVR